VTDATLPVWDNVSTEARETAEDIAVAALRRTAEFMANHCGAEASAWRWGALHTMEYKHPFGYAPVLGALVGRALNIGPFPAAGGAEIVNNMLYSKGHCNFSVVAGPSTRRLIDFNDIAHSLAILPTGNSGNFMSPHYADQAEMFIRGEYRMVRFTPAQIQENARHILEFVPSGGA
ncbi:MAG: penicillin acylase family protein, partial [Candidatus Hydrogenedentes bacterium]|nr:penicillin acylase family protein [Candidatus Hydrogenedentota bacterium]